MKAIKSFLKKVLSEDGGVSSMRLFFLVGFFSFFPPFVLTWVAISINKWELQDIPGGVLILLGAFLGGKVAQKAVEFDRDQK